jgi:hypothetical protein
MIPKGTSHTSLSNSTYEIPKGTMKTRFEPSLLRLSACEIIKFTPRIRTQDPCNSYNYVDISPPKPDTYHKTRIYMLVSKSLKNQ